MEIKINETNIFVRFYKWAYDLDTDPLPSNLCNLCWKVFISLIKTIAFLPLWLIANVFGGTLNIKILSGFFLWVAIGIVLSSLVGYYHIFSGNFSNKEWYFLGTIIGSFMYSMSFGVFFALFIKTDTKKRKADNELEKWMINLKKKICPEIIYNRIDREK